MKIEGAKVNGITCTLEIPDEVLRRFGMPETLSARKAAMCLGVSREVFQRRAKKCGIHPDPLTGKYSRTKILAVVL